MRLLCSLLVAAVPAALAAQNVSELTPAVARLIKTYEHTPDGNGFFSVMSATPELKGTGLWVRYGDPDSPPIRIDRLTGTAKVIGAKGKGPNEFASPTDVVSGEDGLMGVRDVGRMLFFWVDQAGVQRRTWNVPTTDNMQFKTFTDMRGRVYIGRQPFEPDGKPPRPFVVRVDSALGLRDTVMIPFIQDAKWSWVSRNANSATRFYVQFAPYPDWAVDRQGRLLAWWSDSNFVQVSDGGKSTRLVLPAWREPLSAADRKAQSDRLDDIERRVKAQGATFVNARPPVPEYRQQILAAFPTLDGGVAVRRSRACADFKTWKAPITGAAPPDTGRCGYVERFDAKGKRLTPLTYTFRDQILAIRGDTVWMARRDDDDLVKILELLVPQRP